MAGRDQMALYDDDDGGRGGSAVRWIAAAIVVLALVAIGWFVLRPGDDGGETDDDGTVALATTDATADDSATDTTDPEATEPRADETEPTVAETEPTEPTVTTEAPETTERDATSTTAAAPATTTGDQTYETLPDGSPAPVIALFDVSSITLRGAVPSQEAKDRLATLAGQYAKPGQGNIDNQLTINPAIPANVGVRVVELTSVRFPEGTAEVLPEHAAELDRVASVMTALPNVTALVIGHADQRGEELANFAVSEQRADAVVNYIASKGVAPSRMSSRAVGESDLLSLDDDAAALALNRRTEFVLYGLLLP